MASSPRNVSNRDIFWGEPCWWCVYCFSVYYGEIVFSSSQLHSIAFILNSAVPFIVVMRVPPSYTIQAVWTYFLVDVQVYTTSSEPLWWVCFIPVAQTFKFIRPRFVSPDCRHPPHGEVVRLAFGLTAVEDCLADSANYVCESDHKASGLRWRSVFGWGRSKQHLKWGCVMMYRWPGSCLCGK